MLCPGNQYQYCGGRSFMNLYYSPVLKERDEEVEVEREVEMEVEMLDG
jgi:hypothetical protein